ncbi:alpha/beta hydrolase [Salinactinospora qingdaonensis]|uniref:Acyl-CoA:diacylglycerol acyltransferase n=1 Tax=Salinactinospora qingdaonensis TaxID=702744 RepID=A0ABP7F2G5_9ACTN
MFTTLSRRTTVLAASSLLVATAGMAATVDNGVPGTDASVASARPAAENEQRSQPRHTLEPAVQPRPGEVDVCDESGSDDVLWIPDKGAPERGRPIWVHRPPGADSADIPVLYLLHGSTTTHRTLKNADVGARMDEQMCRAGVEFVIAAPFGQEVGGSDTEWGDAADGDFAIETFVTDAAIDAVEGTYQRPRNLRAIGGYSMGGYGAAALALRHPRLYSQAASWGGYFKVDDPSGTFGDDTDSHAPDQLLDTPKAHDIRFFLAEGTEDHTPLQEGSIHGEAERFAAMLRERHMTVQTAFPHGGHDFETWEKTYSQAVSFLTAGWSTPVLAPEPG